MSLWFATRSVYLEGVSPVKTKQDLRTRMEATSAKRRPAGRWLLKSEGVVCPPGAESRPWGEGRATCWRRVTAVSRPFLAFSRCFSLLLCVNPPGHSSRLSTGLSSEASRLPGLRDFLDIPFCHQLKPLFCSRHRSLPSPENTVPHFLYDKNLSVYLVLIILVLGESSGPNPELTEM